MSMGTIGAADIENTKSARASDSDARMLLVEDDEHIRASLAALLADNGYRCTAVEDVVQARAYLRETDFAIVLTDIELPGMSGLGLVMEVVQHHPDTAVFLITGFDDPAQVGKALELGAYGYMVRPLDNNEVLVNVADTLRRRAANLEQRRRLDKFEQLTHVRTDDLREAVTKLRHVETELRNSREETIERLSIAAEFRENETIKHIKRMSGYCEILARGTGHDEEHCEMIRVASQLHDVGKIGIPDHILAKSGPLSEEERNIMKQHTEIGYRILSGSSSEVLSIAASIALTHHERFDGKGYPRRLSGESIPIEGRILAVADVFDGLTSRRSYKDPVPMDQAMAVMRAEADRQLDGDLVDLFLESMDYIKPIRERYADR
ncbi:MAG: response regulator [Actinomycetota bacterium]|nr:response regulator [Actinomycetota bacterium]